MDKQKLQPLVSVLMPCYNSKEYISVAIKSVLESTYQNFELIITDDNSTDGTYEIAKSFEVADQRVKVFKNEKNYGDYPNRNKAASYAIGKYLKYVDHDDYIYPFGLEQLVFYMEQFPEAGYGLCSLDQHKSRIYPFQLNSEDAYKMNYFEMQLFHKAPLSSIIKKEAFDQIGGFTGKPFLGDFEIWHLLSQQFSVVLIPGGIVWYRVHETQESNKLKGNPSKQFEYLLLGQELIKHKNCPLNAGDKQKVIKQYSKKHASGVLSAFKHYGFQKGLELKKASGLSFYQILKYKLS